MKIGMERLGYRFRLGVLAAVAASLLGCVPSPGPTVGSESHFLVYCDAECGSDLACLCGACTQACESDAECKGLAPNARCVTVADRPEEASCRDCKAPAFCDVPCENSGECTALGPEHTCQRGFCRAPEPTGMGANSKIELAELCEFYVEDVCRAEMFCYDWQYRDLDHCRSASDCLGMELTKQAIEQGRIAFDPAKTYECHRRLAEDPCSLGLMLGVPSLEQALAACDAITPKQGRGDPCETTAECQDDLLCITDLQCPGTCLPYAQEGEACGEGLAPCTPTPAPPDCGDICIVANTLQCRDGVCKMPGALGDPCADSSGCASGTFCDTTSLVCTSYPARGEACTARCAPGSRCDTELTDGATCVALSTVGGPCMTPLDCEDGLSCLGFPDGVCESFGTPDADCDFESDCQAGLRCVPDGSDPFGVCAVGPGDTDSPCDEDYDCLDGLACSQTEQVCGALPGEGEACDQRCSEGLSCNSLVCAPILGPGDPCEADATPACTHAYCLDGTCVELLALGAKCADSAQCRSGQCTDGACVDGSGCSN